MSLKDEFYGFSAIVACLKGFQRCFWLKNPWSFSMVSSLGFLAMVSPAQRHYKFGYVDGVDCLD
jgi:hypothetical protein